MKAFVCDVTGKTEPGTPAAPEFFKVGDDHGLRVELFRRNGNAYETADVSAAALSAIQDAAAKALLGLLPKK